MTRDFAGWFVIEIIAQQREPLVQLRSEALEVGVTPGKGGDIVAIRHRPTNRDVLFPTAWLWQELGGSTTPPWFGRTRVIGIEPFTSWPGHGLATIAERTGTQLRLGAGERRDTALRLHGCTGLSEIAGVCDGRAFGDAR